MIALLWLLFSSALVATSSTKAVVTKTDQDVPGNVTVYAIDLAAGTSKAIASVVKDWTAVSGAAVCGGVYYAVFTQFTSMSYGLLHVDLTSTSPEIGVLPTNSLFHKIICDPQSPKSLLGIGSDSALVADEKTRTLKPRAGASFHLKRYNVAAQNETLVATFPAKDMNWGGQDGIFSFKADGSEAWAAWPADNCPDCPNSKKGGHLHVMDTTNGNIKKSVGITGGSLFSKANPYFVVPDAMRGVFDPGNDKKIFWADLTFHGDALAWKKAQPAAELWSSSMPQVNCQGNLLVPHENGHIGAQTIFLVNPKDGSHVAEFDTSKIKTQGSPVFGAVACDASTYEETAKVLV